MIKSKFNQLLALLPDHILIHENVMLAPFTTFKIGGPAHKYTEAKNAKDLIALLSAVRKLELPYFLLGKGANILFSDQGYPGLVIHNKANQIEINLEAQQVTAESGAIVYPDLIYSCKNVGLSGLEHFAGIPSTVGGALWQNLHFLSPAPKRERTVFIEEVLHTATILDEKGDIRVVDVDYFDFGYDYSTLHDTQDIVLSATFNLIHEDQSNIEKIITENLEWRRLRHPPLLTEPSIGSIFKKIEGIGAGRLIDECGLKGKRIGGIEITHRHANIMVNRGGGTAKDVQKMIEEVQETVLAQTGYALETEIQLIGPF